LRRPRSIRTIIIVDRVRLLAKLLRDTDSDLSITLNEHYEEDGETVFREACRFGCEGIVSKKLGSTYRQGRSPLWLKVKNPNAPAAKREAEEDWLMTSRDRAELQVAAVIGADRRGECDEDIGGTHKAKPPADE